MNDSGHHSPASIPGEYPGKEKAAGRKYPAPAALQFNYLEICSSRESIG
jgi:hypothetical protein